MPRRRLAVLAVLLGAALVLPLAAPAVAPELGRRLLRRPAGAGPLRRRHRQRRSNVGAYLWSTLAPATPA
jgi:hypothetical protein